jgi:hypothetical protein
MSNGIIVRIPSGDVSTSASKIHVLLKSILFNPNDSMFLVGGKLGKDVTSNLYTIEPHVTNISLFKINTVDVIPSIFSDTA